MTFSQLRALFCSKISSFYDDDEAMEIFQLLLEEKNKVSRLGFVGMRNEIVSNLDIWEAQIDRLQTGEPVQHILGFADFYGLRINVDKNVLIPRPETEELVQLVLNRTDQSNGIRVLDIGAGSGCIALALKHSRNSFKVSGLDVSNDALNVALHNSQNLGLDIEWILEDIQRFSPKTKYDVIVSNPPYIPVEDQKSMEDRVLKYEPHIALFTPENDPLHYYKIIGEFANKHLIKPGGKLFFEAHHVFADETANYFSQFAETELINDMFGKPRMIAIAF